MAVAEFSQRAHVGHGLRLAPRHIHCSRHGNVGNLPRPHLEDELFEFLQVHVALEGVLARRVVRLVNDDVHEGSARQLLVEARGGEIHVAGDEVARLDHDLGKDVLGAAPLVRGNQVLIAVVLANRLPQVVEVAAARVGFVAEHHARPLDVTHGVGAAVREQVDIDILGAQQEGVVAGLDDELLALLAGRHADGLDHLDLPGLSPGAPGRLWVGHAVTP